MSSLLLSERVTQQQLFRRGIGSAGGVPSIPLPNYPEISWESLNPQPGEDINTVLGRMTTAARVVFPAGNFYMSGNEIAGTNYFTVFAPLCWGWRGQGLGATNIILIANSFGHKVTPPNGGVLAGNGVRISPNDGTGYANGTNGPISYSDLTIIGHQQNTDAGVGMVFTGIYEYQGNGSIFDNIQVLGLGHAIGNSPNVGESMGISLYKTQNALINNMIFDGQGVSGSPMGIHGGRYNTIQNCTLGGSQNSGVTSSYAGSVTDASASGGNIYLNNVIRATGHRFAGMNFEQNLFGATIRGNHISVLSDTMHDFDTAHIFIGSQLASSATSQWYVEDNIVNHVGNADDRYKGALVIAMPRVMNGLTQTIPIANIHVKVAGATLSPVVFEVQDNKDASGNANGSGIVFPGSDFVIDPVTQFLLLHTPRF